MYNEASCTLQPHACIFSADEEVTGGSVKVSLMYGFLPIYKHTFDLCQLLQDVKKSCPVPKGILDVTVGTKLPMDVPGVSWPGKGGSNSNRNSLASFCVII